MWEKQRGKNCNQFLPSLPPPLLEWYNPEFSHKFLECGCGLVAAFVRAVMQCDCEWLTHARYLFIPNTNIYEKKKIWSVEYQIRSTTLRGWQNTRKPDLSFLSFVRPVGLKENQSWNHLMFFSFFKHLKWRCEAKYLRCKRLRTTSSTTTFL